MKRALLVFLSTAAMAQAADPSLTSPAPNNASPPTLPGTSVTFQWADNGTYLSMWNFKVGDNASNPVQYANLTFLPASQTSATVSGLPNDGRTIHVQLMSYEGWGTWVTRDYQFKAPGAPLPPPALSTPLAGSTLSSTTCPFTWTANGRPVQQWFLCVGNTVGSMEFCAKSCSYNELSHTVNSLPADGRPLCVRLMFYISGQWQFTDCTVMAKPLTQYYQTGQPSWWLAKGAVIAGVPAKDDAAATVGQLKNFALAAKAHLEESLTRANYPRPPSPNPAVPSAEPYFTFPPYLSMGRIPATHNQVATVGQLKTIASIFFKRLAEVGYNGHPMEHENSWLRNIASEDKSPATLGQVKMVFSFDLVQYTGPGNGSGGGVGPGGPPGSGESPGTSPGSEHGPNANEEDTDGDGVPNATDAYPTNSALPFCKIGKPFYAIVEIPGWAADNGPIRAVNDSGTVLFSPRMASNPSGKLRKWSKAGGWTTLSDPPQITLTTNYQHTFATQNGPGPVTEVMTMTPGSWEASSLNNAGQVCGVLGSLRGIASPQLGLFWNNAGAVTAFSDNQHGSGINFTFNATGVTRATPLWQDVTSGPVITNSGKIFVNHSDWEGFLPATNPSLNIEGLEAPIKQNYGISTAGNAYPLSGTGEEPYTFRAAQGGANPGEHVVGEIGTIGNLWSGPSIIRTFAAGFCPRDVETVVCNGKSYLTVLGLGGIRVRFDHNSTWHSSNSPTGQAIATNGLILAGSSVIADGEAHGLIDCINNPLNQAGGKPWSHLAGEAMSANGMIGASCLKNGIPTKVLLLPVQINNLDRYVKGSIPKGLVDTLGGLTNAGLQIVGQNSGKTYGPLRLSGAFVHSPDTVELNSDAEVARFDLNALDSRAWKSGMVYCIKDERLVFMTTIDAPEPCSVRLLKDGQIFASMDYDVKSNPDASKLIDALYAVFREAPFFNSNTIPLQYRTNSFGPIYEDIFPEDVAAAITSNVEFNPFDPADYRNLVTRCMEAAFEALQSKIKIVAGAVQGTNGEVVLRQTCSYATGFVYGIWNGLKGDWEGLVELKNLLLNPIDTCNGILQGFRAMLGLTKEQWAQLGQAMFRSMMSNSEQNLAWVYQGESPDAEGLTVYFSGFGLGFAGEQATMIYLGAGLVTKLGPTMKAIMEANKLGQMGLKITQAIASTPAKLKALTRKTASSVFNWWSRYSRNESDFLRLLQAVEGLNRPPLPDNLGSHMTAFHRSLNFIGVNFDTLDATKVNIRKILDELGPETNFKKLDKLDFKGRSHVCQYIQRLGQLTGILKNHNVLSEQALVGFARSYRFLSVTLDVPGKPAVIRDRARDLFELLNAFDNQAGAQRLAEVLKDFASKTENGVGQWQRFWVPQVHLLYPKLYRITDTSKVAFDNGINTGLTVLDFVKRNRRLPRSDIPADGSVPIKRDGHYVSPNPYSTQALTRNALQIDTDWSQCNLRFTITSSSLDGTIGRRCVIPNSADKNTDVLNRALEPKSRDHAKDNITSDAYSGGAGQFLIEGGIVEKIEQWINNQWVVVPFD